MPRVATGDRWRQWLLIAACLLLAAAFTIERIETVWDAGNFFDTDDATRAVQLRAWMGGQGWYDLTIGRMDPPTGVFMHWSRVVDVPLAVLVRVAEVFTDPVTAERVARLAFPFLCLTALLFAAGWAASVHGGPRARPIGIVLCFLGAPFLGQFIPGRIDHHAPQIILLMVAVGAMLASFDERRASLGAVAGGACALSLAISLENLPFFTVLCAAYPLWFVARGPAAARAMGIFAAAFAGALLLVFGATVGPAHWTERACDALSVAHLAGGLAGCAALAALAAAAPRLRTPAARMIAVLAAAVVPLATLRLVAPQCLGDPFVGLDPLVREIWLRNVGEVEPLPSFLHTQPWSALAMLVPVLAGIAVSLWGAWTERGVARARNLLLAGLLAVGLGTTVWGIRAFSSTLPLVAIAAAPVVRRVFDRPGFSAVGRSAGALLVAIPFAPMALAFATPADPAPSRSRTLACLTPAAFAPLATLPRGNVLAPIDAGAHLLAFTSHGVFGAPYHRDNAGNRLVLDAFLAPPERARAIVGASPADYVALCPDSAQAQVMASRAPDGLAAQLLRGVVPDWLVPIPLADTPQQAYRIRRTP